MRMRAICRDLAHVRRACDRSIRRCALNLCGMKSEFSSSRTMASLAWLLVVCCTTTLYGAHGQTTPVCNRDDYTGDTGPAPPSLPRQFSTTIQAVISSYSNEIVVREYFDEINNRGRLEYSSNGSSGYGIFDYDLQEIFLLPDFRTGEECAVRRIAQNDSFLRQTFGFTNVNGSVHIGTVSDFFRLADTQYVRYVGAEEVRGIPCDRWQACSVSGNRSYIIDYYFSNNSISNWTSAFRNDPVPVQISLNGTNGEHPVYNLYTFVGFNSGPDSVPDEMFQLPTGIVCRGRIPGQDVPLLPNFFSTYIEAVDEDSQRVSVFREFYDLDTQLMRYDFYYRGQLGGSPAPLSIIHDFNLETQYIINKQYNNCSVSAITPDSPFFDITVTDGMPRLSSPSELFLLSNEFNYSYEGVSTIRGVDVDSWISYREFETLRNSNLTDATYEVFFTRPDWSFQSASSPASSTPIPWRVRLSGVSTFMNSTTNLTESSNFSSTFDLFGFNVGEPDLDVFDTSVCINSSEYYILNILLRAVGSDVDFSLLRRNVRNGFAAYTGMEMLQIGNIQVTGSSSTHIFLTLRLSNLTSVSRQQVTNPVTAQQALDKLLQNINSGKLDFVIQLAPGSSVPPILYYASTGNGTTVYPSTTSSSSEEDGSSSGLSNGEVAALAISLLALGLILGMVGTMASLFLIRHIQSKSSYDLRRTGAVSYERQEDDVTVPASESTKQ